MHVVRNNRLEEVPDDDPDVDYELLDPTQQFGTHTNTIPLQSAVQVPRLFYGGRFVNQALSIDGGEAPLVQNLDTMDKDGRSFDEIIGESLGAVRAKQRGRVISVNQDRIRVKYEDGTTDDIGLYKDMPFNQKSVAGDTSIIIRREDGEIYTGSIAAYEWREGDTTLSYSTEDFNGSWQPVTAKIEHQHAGHMLRVTYASGRSVEVTPDHSLLQFGGVNIDPVLPGDCVLGVTKSPWAALLPQGDCESVDPQGVLVGLYLAEGDLPLRKGELSGVVRIAVDPADRRAQVNDLMLQLGFEPHANRSRRASFCDSTFAAWLRDNCGRGAGNKFISDDLKSRNADFLWGIVVGFLSGDGCMEQDSNGVLHLHTAVTSRRLRDDLVDILCLLGVRATVFERGRACYSERWNDAYGFRILGADVIARDVWFFYKDRQESLVKWRPKCIRSSPFETMHVVRADGSIEQLRSLGLDDVWRPNGKSRARAVRKKGEAYFIPKYLAAEGRGRFADVASSNLLWDTVVSVEVTVGDDTVYDLSVRGSEAFAVAGGLLVHNSGITSRPLLQKGDSFEPGQVVVASNFTDDNGTQNMGLNARIGLVPWKGFSMDDAIPISESFAKRLTATQYKVIKQDKQDNLKTGLNHFRALSPNRFSKKVLENFDDDGLVRPGTVLEPGDPVLLATMPRTLSSSSANVGKLSKPLRQQRRDASKIWDGNQPAEVVAAAKTKNGYKIVLKYHKPTKEGDKIVLRQGAKGTVSRVIPDDQMPHTEDGEPLDLLLNPLSLVSRANPASQHEIRLGKIAKKLGKPLKVPSYLPKGESWNDYLDKLEAEHGIQSKERVFDPETNRFLAEPITVGYGFVPKLHHTSEGKLSSRGTGSYDQNQQPTRGSGEMAQAKQYSGLENYATLSSGAYALMRENSTLKGQQNHDFWQALRADKPLPKINEPFVWHKFRALLAGAGMNTRETGKGRYRLAPFTDKDLDAYDPVDVENGELVRLQDFTPVKGGLFDERLLSNEKWGRVRLPRPIINPASEDSVRVMLGLTKKQMEDVLAGKLDLEEAMGS